MSCDSPITLIACNAPIARLPKKSGSERNTELARRAAKNPRKIFNPDQSLSKRIFRALAILHVLVLDDEVVDLNGMLFPIVERSIQFCRCQSWKSQREILHIMCLPVLPNNFPNGNMSLCKPRNPCAVVFDDRRARP